MRWSFVSFGLVLAACGPGLAKQRENGPLDSWAMKADGQRVRRGMDRIVAAAGDAVVLEQLLAPGVTFGGVWFPDPDCRKQFTRIGPIEPSYIPSFAKCLATLAWTPSARSTRSPDSVLLTYEPGLELEVLLSREDEPRILWIGFVSRIVAADNPPTITQAALEAHRIEPTPIPGEHALWAKLCIDETGAVTSVRPDMVTMPAAQEALLAHLKQWRFQPFELEGAGAPVCSVFRVGATVEGFERVPPVYSEAAMQGITVPPTSLRWAEGHVYISPTMMRSRSSDARSNER